LSLAKKIARGIARTDFARKAVEEKADLTLFKARLSARVILGIILIGFSYLIGWPAVALFGILSIYLGQPLILIIGGPVIYGISHLVFIAGLYLAGSRYSYIFLRWATRKALEKVLGEDFTADHAESHSGSIVHK
jgi:hypothetical protein